MSLYLYLHGLDPGVVLCGELFEDEVGVLVDANEVAGLQLLWLDEPDHRQEVCLPSRRLDHSALACDGILPLFKLLWDNEKNSLNQSSGP